LSGGYPGWFRAAGDGRTSDDLFPSIIFRRYFRVISKENKAFVQRQVHTQHQREEGRTAMRMTIRYEGGIRQEAVLMAANRERMRIAMPSRGDTIELNRASGYWLTESGKQVEIEALIPIDGVDVSQFCAAVYPLTMTAGHVPAFD
jgi:hypothetical protein